MFRQCEVCKKNSMSHPDLSFHKLPSDTEKRKIWASLLGFESDDFTKKLVFICANHFNPDDIGMKSNETKFLKPDVFPLPYHTTFEISNESSDANDIQTKKNGKRFIKQDANPLSSHSLFDNSSISDNSSKTESSISEQDKTLWASSYNPDESEPEHRNSSSTLSASECENETNKVKEEKEGIPDTPPITEVCIEEQNLQQKTKIPLQDTIDEEIIKVEYLEEYQPTNDLSTEEIMSDLSDLGCSTVSAKNRRKRSISDKDRSSVEQYSSKKQKLNAAQEQSKKSSSELFLLSLVPHLESMTDHQQLSFQRQVIQLLEIIKFPDNKDH